MEAQQAKRKTDRMLEASYLQDIDRLSYDELKARRDESMAVEQEISYSRRLIQGKLDILRHALQAGEQGQERSLRGVIDQLPAILADPGGRGASTRHTPVAAPGEPAEGRRELERLTGEVADIDKMSAEELSQAVERLAQAEKKASEERKRVQEVIDSLNDELVRRLQAETGAGG